MGVVLKKNASSPSLLPLLLFIMMQACGIGGYMMSNSRRLLFPSDSDHFDHIPAHHHQSPFLHSRVTSSTSSVSPTFSLSSLTFSSTYSLVSMLSLKMASSSLHSSSPSRLSAASAAAPASDSKHSPLGSYAFEGRLQSQGTQHGRYNSKDKDKDEKDKLLSAPKFQGKAKRGQLSFEERKRQVDKVLNICRNPTDSHTLSLTELNQAIVLAGRIGRVDDAVKMFRSIEALGFQADIMSYNNVIWSAGNAAKADLAKGFLQELLTSRQKLHPNVYTYGALMHGCAKAKNHKLAMAYLERMQSENLIPNQVVLTSAMEACAEAGQYKEALAVMDKMKNVWGMKPDLTMVNAAIKACSLSGAMEEAEGLAQSLREMGTMDVFTYHTLMMGNTKLGRHYRVLALYDEAIASGAILDGGVYSLAMLAALNCGLPQQVPRIADRARNEKVTLTEASYTTLIQAYAEAGDVESSLECLDRMVAEGLKPNVITYAAAMTALRDRPTVVISLLARMREEDIEPNTVVLTTAIDSLARAGGEHTKMAYQMLRMMETKGPEPNIYTYNTVTRAFAEAGRLEEAISILQTIKKRGLEPDRFTFTTLLIACGRNGNSARVTDVMTIMRNAGIVPDEIAYGAAIDAYRRDSNSLKAVECLHDMYKHGVEPTAAHYNLVLRTLKSEGYVDKMFQMVMAIGSKSKEAKINGNTFELVIEALLDVDKWKESLLLLRMMDRLDFKPSMHIYISLVEKLEKAREYKAALALYKLMSKDGSFSFYENGVLNSIFKRLVHVAAAGVDADLQRAATDIAKTLIPEIQKVSDVLEDILAINKS